MRQMHLEQRYLFFFFKRNFTNFLKFRHVGMFPMDMPKNIKFAINYFMSVGLGVITEEMKSVRTELSTA